MLQALQSIDEAYNTNQENTGTIADDASQSRDMSSRFAQLDDEEKVNIVTETESASTKRQIKHGVKILPFGDLLCVLYFIRDIFLLV